MIRTVAVTGAVRIIAPGDLQSQDFDASRINLQTDAAGNIWRITCG